MEIRLHCIILAERQSSLLSRAREQIAGLIEVKPNEIYFTSGGTEGNNLAVKGAAMMHRIKRESYYYDSC